MLYSMNILSNVNLRPYNTFHLDCIAKFFVTITNSAEFLDLAKTQEFKDNPRFILGGWSNILLTKDQFEWLVIKNEIMWKKVVEQTPTSVKVKVGAGENRNDFVERAIEEGYCWMENLARIPGNVGAAPMQNIGAYGVEAKSIITQVEWVDYSDINNPKTITWSNSDCCFGYRDSCFKQKYKNKAFITYVTYQLQKYDPETYQPNVSYWSIQEHLLHHAVTLTPRVVADVIGEIRASKLPDRTVIGTAGSFFKNPIVDNTKYEALLAKFPKLNGHPHNKDSSAIKLNAWQLIELSGLKWLTQWPVWTYQNHALVLVNNWGGTGEQLLKLANYIIDKVHETFWVTLEPEVNLI